MSHSPPVAGTATTTHTLPPDSPGPHNKRLGLVAVIATFGGLFFPTLVAGIGISYTFFLFAAVGVISILFVKTMVPETRGRSLEQLEEDFRTHGDPVEATVR